MKFLLNPGQLTLKDIQTLLDETTTLELNPKAHQAILASEKIVLDTLLTDKIVYGINTGFGILANHRIALSDIGDLQRSIVLSHAAGVGDLLCDKAVRLILALKINSLARGYSGVCLKTIEALIALFNAKVYPCIPAQGSVGASGDLAPLAHMSLALLGIGNIRYNGEIIPAIDGLKLAKIQPLSLAAKEGLALLNGTQVSTALALLGVLATENIFIAAICAGAMSVEASLASNKPFDERIHLVRGHNQQIAVARMLRSLLQESEINSSHRSCNTVQDPYSLRCQPQVMGACLAHLQFAKDTLLIEANAVSDNPIVFAQENEILSGGNFHAEPVAMAADTLALSIAEIGALSERRIAILTDKRFSRLPEFLVDNAGINSGFMIAQVTAAALASENKCLANPASVDSLPTSANQEDHVSMATYAARRLLPMAENTAGIIAIELLASCQGINFRRPLKTTEKLEKIFLLVREQVAFYDRDRFFAPDIEAAKNIVKSCKLKSITEIDLFT
jgi:histidine ammonia-lyase